MNEFRTFYEQKKGARDILLSQLEDVNEKYSIKVNERGDIEEAQVIIQTVAQQTQGQLQYHIEDLVTKALEAVFPDPYAFKLKFELKRGQTEAVTTLERDGVEVSPVDSTGGGVIDVAAFALRVALWALGHTDNVIILDEPFKHLSAIYQPKAGEMMKMLSEQLGLQFILVTHVRQLEEAADKMLYVSIRDGESLVLTK